MGCLTVLILTRNEEEHIQDCITSVAFADEIIVIDDFSTDRTQEIAVQMGARVIAHAMNGNFGAQRNFAIDQASSEWILFLDADERISSDLAKEIRKIVDGNRLGAYWIERVNRFHYNRATHGVLRSDWVLRLLPKDGACVDGFVHEKIQSSYEDKRLQSPMYHYTYDNWEQYFNKFNAYTQLAARQYQDRGKRCSFVKDIVFRPLWAFIKVYLIDKGFMDGKIGWILSVNHYFYTMTKYVRLYYLYKSNGKL